MFIYRKEDEDNSVTQLNQIPATISIAKHRNGPTGEIELMFKGDRIKFYGIDKKREA
jgi:replicative DNA helicase